METALGNCASQSRSGNTGNDIRKPKECYETIYPNIRILLQIFCTIPVTVATNESEFSALRRLKTYLRTAMKQNRLTALAILVLHRDRIVDPNEVVQRFFAKGHRAGLAPKCQRKLFEARKTAKRASKKRSLLTSVHVVKKANPCVQRMNCCKQLERLIETTRYVVVTHRRRVA